MSFLVLVWFSVCVYMYIYKLNYFKAHLFILYSTQQVFFKRCCSFPILPQKYCLNEIIIIKKTSKIFRVALIWWEGEGMVWSEFYLQKEKPMSRSFSVFREMTPETMKLNFIFVNAVLGLLLTLIFSCSVTGE